MSKRRESRTGDNSALCVIFLQPALSVRVKTRRFKGVHFLQGYLYSPPVPGNKFISEWVMKAGG
ncbi:hypothetical protein F6J46_10325 [Escherichia coli]|nr:hypothetical protein [Escherichia coli]EFD5336100.1 hypothetical protein [Escherichia coli]EFE7790131.1 hypothetical protein [Escherichia coli]